MNGEELIPPEQLKYIRVLQTYALLMLKLGVKQLTMYRVSARDFH